MIRAWVFVLDGVCHRHRGVTRAFVLTEYGP